jgi:hypothetical protein
LTGGLTYKFIVRARNVYDYGPLSDPVSVTAIDKPGKMATPTVTISGINVVVAWTLPNIHSSTITAYDIQFKKSDGTFVPQLTYCDGTQTGIVTARTCSIPMAAVIALTGRAVDTLITVKINALNARGYGDYSEVNTVGALIEQVPD